MKKSSTSKDEIWFRRRQNGFIYVSCGTSSRAGSSPDTSFACVLGDAAHPKKTPKLRSWRVIVIRSKREYLGSVEAPNRVGR
jgi:hypothetical protein